MYLKHLQTSYHMFNFAHKMPKAALQVDVRKSSSLISWRLLWTIKNTQSLSYQRADVIEEIQSKRSLFNSSIYEERPSVSLFHLQMSYISCFSKTPKRQ